MSEVMLSAASLVTPEAAVASVSRSEVVNLMVLDYIQRAEVEVAALTAEYEAAAAQSLVAVTAAWEAYQSEAKERVYSRCAAWREATAEIVAPKVIEKVGISQIPDGCEPSASGQIRSGYQYSDREFATLSAVVTRWLLDGVKGTPIDAPLSDLYYRQSAPIAVSRFPVEVWLTIEGVSGGVDVNRVKFVIDISPSQQARTLLDEARRAVVAMNVVYARLNQVRSTVSAENIGRLERRALAALTRATLGPLADTLPQIAVLS